MHVFPLASRFQFTYEFRLRLTSILCSLPAFPFYVTYTFPLSLSYVIRLSAFTYMFHLRSVSVFPFCVSFLRSFSLFAIQCALSICSDWCYHYLFVRVLFLSVRVFLFCFGFFTISLFKAHLIFPFSHNSMQFLSSCSCISKIAGVYRLRFYCDLSAIYHRVLRCNSRNSHALKFCADKLHYNLAKFAPSYLRDFEIVTSTRQKSPVGRQVTYKIIKLRPSY